MISSPSVQRLKPDFIFAPTACLKACPDTNHSVLPITIRVGYAFAIDIRTGHALAISVGHAPFPIGVRPARVGCIRARL